jgi:hypothetical protein
MTSRPVTRCSGGARSLCAVVPPVAPLLAVLCSGRPELPDRSREPVPEQLDGSAPIELEPAAPLDAAPPVLRIHLRLGAVATDQVDLSRITVVRGEVGPGHLRQIERGELSKALSKRVVPASLWLDETDTGEAWAIVAPTVPLAPGETYTVVGGTPPSPHEIRIAAAEESPPVLPRVWPPIDFGATLTAGVWCGEAPLPESAAAADLMPGGPHGELKRGAVDGIGARCLRFEAAPGAMPTELGERSFVGPPAAGGEPPVVSLDPRPFVLETEPAPAAAAACEPDEVQFGPGCAHVMDDRIRVRAAEAPLLWAIAGERLDEVVTTRAGEPFVLTPLPPLSAVALAVATVDNAGRVERHALSTTTLAPMPHVVINEVLANPLGSEPAQEWVELYNDSSVPASLDGYVLSDVGAETALPSASLAPGAYALIVNEAYADDDELDPPLPPEALLLRVPRLGNHGLSNSGEPLKLMDAGGAVLSRSPALPASRAGMSLSRVKPHAPDGLAVSFVSSWPTPARENIINKEMY